MVDMVFDFQLPDPIHVEVLGNSGMLAFDIIGPIDAFLGFEDAAGLVPVSFQNMKQAVPGGEGPYNYSFDDVTSAGPRDFRIPEPSTSMLLLLGLGAALSYRRRTPR